MSILAAMADTSPAADTKRCCKCGKDLSGHTRYKNHEGYWCRKCSAEDELRKRRLGGGRRHRGAPAIAAVSVIAVLALLYWWLH